VLGLVLASSCGPTSHRRHGDDWDDAATVLEPEISGDNAKDEARWRNELASDPWGDDSALLTDDPPKTADEYQESDADVPFGFVGPPAPPTSWEKMQHRSTTFGRIFFSIMTVFVTLGMMAAPYLLMI
jgi:hypothetical protein